MKLNIPSFAAVFLATVSAQDALNPAGREHHVRSGNYHRGLMPLPVVGEKGDICTERLACDDDEVIVCTFRGGKKADDNRFKTECVGVDDNPNVVGDFMKGSMDDVRDDSSGRYEIVAACGPCECYGDDLATFSTKSVKSLSIKSGKSSSKSKRDNEDRFIINEATCALFVADTEPTNECSFREPACFLYSSHTALSYPVDGSTATVLDVLTCPGVNSLVNGVGNTGDQLSLMRAAGIDSALCPSDDAPTFPAVCSKKDAEAFCDEALGLQEVTNELNCNSDCESFVTACCNVNDFLLDNLKGQVNEAVENARLTNSATTVLAINAGCVSETGNCEITDIIADYKEDNGSYLLADGTRNTYVWLSGIRELSLDEGNNDLSTPDPSEMVSRTATPSRPSRPSSRPSSPSRPGGEPIYDTFKTSVVDGERLTLQFNDARTSRQATYLVFVSYAENAPAERLQQVFIRESRMGDPIAYDGRTGMPQTNIYSFEADETAPACDATVTDGPVCEEISIGIQSLSFDNGPGSNSGISAIAVLRIDPPAECS